MIIKEHIQTELKQAMRAQDKKKIGALRLITAAIKQIEIDERIDVDDTRVLVILDKMVKQRKESLHQFQSAGRDDLAAQERYEIDLIQSYLPTPLTDAEILVMIEEAFRETKAEKLSDMGKVMAHLKPLMQGRADMSIVSAIIKTRL